MLSSSRQNKCCGFSLFDLQVNRCDKSMTKKLICSPFSLVRHKRTYQQIFVGKSRFFAQYLVVPLASEMYLGFSATFGVGFPSLYVELCWSYEYRHQ